MFLGFEIANNKPKFKNKFHYKMRFFIKNKTYKIFFIIFCLSTGYAQPTLSPGILLKSEIVQTGEHYFYIFQEQAVVLYEINTHSQYQKIWEYGFLKKLNLEELYLYY